MAKFTVSDVQVGDVFATAGSQFFSKAIMAITDSPVSHITTYVGNGFCFEENGFTATGAASAPAYLASPGTHILRLKPEYRAKISAVIDDLRSHTGEPYDDTEIAILLAKYTLGIDVPHHDLQKAICSTILARALNDKGIPAFPGKNLDEVIPKDYLSSPVFDLVGITG